ARLRERGCGHDRPRRRPSAARRRRLGAKGRHASHLRGHGARANGSRLRADGHARARARRRVRVAQSNAVIKLRILSIVALTATLAACAARSRNAVPTGTTEPDKFLFDKGTENLNKKKWITAREFFKQVTETYTQSPMRPDAKLGIGDTYLGEGTAEALVLAINEFKEFLSFYPTHRRADYAQLKLGLAHFRQMRHPQHD